MSETSEGLIQLVKDLEDALLLVHGRAGKVGLTLRKAELEVQGIVEQSKVGGGKFAFKIVPIEVGMQIDRTKVHTFTLALNPRPGQSDLGWDQSNELADAIIAIAATVKEIAALNSARFSTGDIGVELHVELQKGGKLQIVFGGSRSATSAHTVKLTFVPT